MFSRIVGRVTKGEARGRKLGFPTANLIIDDAVDMPSGIYAGRAQVVGDVEEYLAAIHVGERPTFEGLEPTFEVHLLDYGDKDLYGKELEVIEMKFLREIKKFDSEDDLIDEITEDCERVREIYAAS